MFTCPSSASHPENMLVTEVVLVSRVRLSLSYNLVCILTEFTWQLRSLLETRNECNIVCNFVMIFIYDDVNVIYLLQIELIRKKDDRLSHCPVEWRH